MNDKKKDVVKGLLIFSGVLLSIAGALTVLYKVFTKHFKISIEMCPDEDDDEECSCDECRKSDDIEFDITSDDAPEEEPAEEAKDE